MQRQEAREGHKDDGCDNTSRGTSSSVGQQQHKCCAQTCADRREEWAEVTGRIALHADDEVETARTRAPPDKCCDEQKEQRCPAARGAQRPAAAGYQR